MKFKAVMLALVALLGAADAYGQTPTMTYRYGGHTYKYVPGSFTQRDAWMVASQLGGYPVVFNSLLEHASVVNSFGFQRIAPAWTGHYQLASGLEPGLGWVTINGQPSAPLHQLFNSDGPDDGIRNKWGWSIGPSGLSVYYGASNGKNEDGAVIWHDNAGRLEDVSINHRGGVVVEFNR
jgi:hypothetical protein